MGSCNKTFKQIGLAHQVIMFQEHQECFYSDPRLINISLNLQNDRVSQRRSTSSYNFPSPCVPPSMPTLPSRAYYSLHRNKERNNLNLDNNGKFRTLHYPTRIPELFPHESVQTFNLDNRDIVVDTSTSDYTSAKGWSENTTVTARSSSDYSESQALVMQAEKTSVKRIIQMHSVLLSQAIFSLPILLSPFLMLVLPKMEFMKLKHSQLKCGVGCEGHQLSFTFKTFILVVGFWAVFYQRKRSILPKQQVYDLVLVMLLSILLICFWTTFIFNYLLNSENIKYETVVDFVANYFNILLFLHYLALILLKLPANLHPEFAVHILRSPDGKSQTFLIGRTIVQEAAHDCLKHYYTKFDGLDIKEEDNSLKKKAALLDSTEAAFKQLRKYDSSNVTKGDSLDFKDAAREIFPRVFPSLQRYLKSNETPLPTIDTIIKHLSTSIKYGMSPRAFLERFTTKNPILQDSLSVTENWSLSSSRNLYVFIKSGDTFLLKQKEVTLMCRVMSLKEISITAEQSFSKEKKFAYVGSKESPV